MLIESAFLKLSFGVILAISASGAVAQEVPLQLTTTPAENQAPAVVITPKLPAEMPPKLPQVTCIGGQLKISAENSTLRSILRAVQSCIGVQIDFPDGVPETRTYEELGPGPVREVLDQLLSSTSLNYVIESTDLNPQKIQSVLLISRTGEGPVVAELAAPSSAASLTPQRRGWMATHQATQLSRVGPAAEESAQSAPESTTAPALENAAATPPASAAPDLAKPLIANQASSGSTPDPAAAQVQTPAPSVTDLNPNATPDQVTQGKITDMQQMFEQRKKMIENENSPPKPQ